VTMAYLGKAFDIEEGGKLGEARYVDEEERRIVARGIGQVG